LIGVRKEVVLNSLFLVCILSIGYLFTVCWCDDFLLKLPLLDSMNWTGEVFFASLVCFVQNAACFYFIGLPQHKCTDVIYENQSMFLVAGDDFNVRCDGSYLLIFPGVLLNSFNNVTLPLFFYFLQFMSISGKWNKIQSSEIKIYYPVIFKQNFFAHPAPRN